MTTISEQATQVRLATVRLARRIRAQKSDDRVTDSQLTVLVHLTKRGAMTLSQLAEAERISAPSMNRTVDCLESDGHVTRTQDETDRRKTNIALTPTGQGIVTATVSLRNAWLTEHLRHLSAEERATLVAAAEIMGRLATA